MKQLKVLAMLIPLVSAPVPGGVGSVTAAILARHVTAQERFIRVKGRLPHGVENNYKELDQERVKLHFACW